MTFEMLTFVNMFEAKWLFAKKELSPIYFHLKKFPEKTRRVACLLSTDIEVISASPGLVMLSGAEWC
jgi:hypothetical protein